MDGASQVALMVKNPPTNAGDVRDLTSLNTQEIFGWGESQLGGMATHSSILTWRISWAEEPGGLQSMGSQRDGHFWIYLAHMYFDG